MEFLDGSGGITRALPTVSVLVAAHNYAEFVGRALDSVLAQDYPAELVEIVVVDDGSTDETPEVLEEYRCRHPDRIRIIRQANAGNKAAANTAVAAAKGELLAMLDADDTWPPDKVRRQALRLVEDESLGLVYCDSRVIDEHDRALRPSYWEWLEITPQRGSEAFGQLMGGQGNIAVNSTIMLRAELARKIFPIPLRMPFQDWWITGWAACLSGIDAVDGVRIGYRQHGSNGTLGATGSREVWALCKTVESRRQMLIHGGGEHLDEHQLLEAWRAWEDKTLEAAHRAWSAYLPLIEPTEEERDQGRGHAAAAASAIERGELLGALRSQLRALACDPANSEYRELMRDLDWVVVSTREKQPEPGCETRTFVTLTNLDQLRDEPKLLRTYAAVVGPEDDATLAIEAVETEHDVVVQEVVAAAERAGLDSLPDVLLVVNGGIAAKQAIERRANTVLASRPWEFELPAFRPAAFPLLSRFARLPRLSGAH